MGDEIRVLDEEETDELISDIYFKEDEEKDFVEKIGEELGIISTKAYASTTNYGRFSGANSSYIKRTFIILYFKDSKYMKVCCNNIWLTMPTFRLTDKVEYSWNGACKLTEMNGVKYPYSSKLSYSFVYSSDHKECTEYFTEDVTNKITFKTNSLVAKYDVPIKAPTDRFYSYELDSLSFNVVFFLKNNGSDGLSFSYVYKHQKIKMNALNLGLAAANAVAAIYTEGGWVMVADISSAVFGANSFETYYAVLGGDSNTFYFDYSKNYK